jgi:hypothetical protein
MGALCRGIVGAQRERPTSRGKVYDNQILGEEVILSSCCAR